MDSGGAPKSGFYPPEWWLFISGTLVASKRNGGFFRPDYALWISIPNGKPFWQQIMHILIGIKFWFRDSEEAFSPPDFGQGPVPDIDSDANYVLTKKQVQEYQNQMEKRIIDFFERMDDKRLLQESIVYKKNTYADIILSQIRHFQHHIGYCNSILHEHNAKPAKWL